MFEKEIQFIYDFNLNKVKKLGSYLTYEQLASAEIHPALLQYVSAEIEFLIFEDRQKLLKDSLFDYSGESINRFFKNISEEIKITKRFSIEYISKLLLHASSFNVNYIVRPKWALLKFLFEDEKEKQVAEVKQILNYLYYHTYLKNILNSYFSKKRLLTIKYEDFEDLLNRIDKINIDTNFDNLIDEALKSMAEFLNIGEVKNTKVSIKAVELFLEDKGLAKHQNKLKDTFNDSSILKYEIRDFEKILFSVENETEEEIEFETVEKPESKSEEIEENVLSEEIEEVKEFKELEVDEIIEAKDLPDEEVLEEDSAKNIPDNEEEIETDEVIHQIESDVVEEIDDPAKDEIEKSEIEDEIPSFLEERIENLEMDNGHVEEDDVDDKEELEIPEIDEEARLEVDDVDDVYELAKEESELNNFTDESSAANDPELVISEEDEIDSPIFKEDSSEEIDQISDEENEEKKIPEEYDEAKDLYLKEMEQEENSESKDEYLNEVDKVEDNETDDNTMKENDDDEEREEAEEDPEKYVPEGTSVTFSADDLVTSQEAFDEVAEEEIKSDEDEILSEETELEENSDEKDLDVDQQDEITLEETVESVEESEPKIDEEEIDEIDKSSHYEKLDRLIETDEDDELEMQKVTEDVEVESSEDDEETETDSTDILTESSDEPAEPNLFNEELSEKTEEDSENLNNDNDENEKEDATGEEEKEESISEPIQIDVSELLNNKKMTKIIEVIFDYDMEDFANTIDKISECTNKEDALLVISDFCRATHTNESSKEIKTFKSIISEYFDLH